MEQGKVRFEAGRLYLDGYPDAVKLAAVIGPHAKQLADLADHRRDLEFAHAAAVRLRDAPNDPDIVREALWRSAIVTYRKCFDRASKRRALRAECIYDEGVPREVFAYFKRLRDKDIAHDDRAYSAYSIGAVIGPDDGDRKVQEILYIGMRAQHLDGPMLTNLGLLIEGAHQWVVKEFERVAAEKVAEMRTMSYSDLLDLPNTEVRPSFLSR
ncbi:hypothetical protein [Rhodococcus sp. Chr-9]|uniref:hypothetical protein n=1 Tax=Rhodococcus sp. Chr-9 TaxID=713612 RepID=UPI000575BBAA|nr:hypothetical protein [Rhodococcus sp. Chr-9]KHJ74171.1 hypothetical protein QR64_03030 [Rhodococcus sp. Chr-9]